MKDKMRSSSAKVDEPPPPPEKQNEMRKKDRKTENDKFIVKELPNRGMGVVAIRKISRGELIVAENPLFIVPWWVRHSTYPR